MTTDLALASCPDTAEGRTTPVSLDAGEIPVSPTDVLPEPGRAALRYAQLGFSVIPFGPDKKPLFPWKAYQTRRPTAVDIERWFNGNGDVPPALAVVCGSVSGGLCVLDFDREGFYERWRVAVPADLADTLVSLPVQRTGSRIGYQVFFRCPKPGGNLKIARHVPPNSEKPEIDVETRGEGCCAVLPPSRCAVAHPDGAAYEWIGGFPREIPTVSQETADRLLGAARALDEMSEKKVTRKVRTKATRVREGGTNPLEFTDAGDAAWLVDRHGHEIRYNHEPHREWFCDTGPTWKLNSKQEIHQVIDSHINYILQIAAGCGDSERRKALITHAKKLSGIQKQKNVLAMLTTRPELQIEVKDLDAHIYFFNVINGTFDLESGEPVFRPHRREDYLTACAPVEYQPGATCPNWIQFLNRIFNGDEALIQFVQRVVGYSLTGDTSEQYFYFFHGVGANGKTVFFEVIFMLFGEDYTVKSNIEMVLLQRQTRETHEVARLVGKRICVLSEIPAGRRLNESLVKDLTGSGAVDARNLYERGFSFHPQAKLFMYGNHKPVIGDSMSIWRRVQEIPFTVTIPKEEQIPMRDLLNTFRPELPGILNWALDGYCSYREQGLRPPNAVTKAVNEYREESDTLHRFMEEHCQELASLSTPCKAVFEQYKKWCENNGEHPVSMRVLTTKFKERGFEIRAGTGNVKFIHGLGLL